METRLEFVSVGSKFRRCAFSNFVGVNPVNSGGGLWLGWNNFVSLNILFVNTRVILASIVSLGKGR